MRFRELETLSLSQGAWAVVDQALFALSNFLLNLLLTRWLSPREPGAFTMAFSVFHLVGIVHTAFLVEPMMVFDSGRHRGHLSRYLRALLVAPGLFSLAVAALLLGIALALREDRMSLSGQSGLHCLTGGRAPVVR